MHIDYVARQDAPGQLPVIFGKRECHFTIPQYAISNYTVLVI
jgi:hypothetical protein